MANAFLKEEKQNFASIFCADTGYSTRTSSVNIIDFFFIYNVKHLNDKSSELALPFDAAGMFWNKIRDSLIPMCGTDGILPLKTN